MFDSATGTIAIIRQCVEVFFVLCLIYQNSLVAYVLVLIDAVVCNILLRTDEQTLEK
jgi:hypothetical protein